MITHKSRVLVIMNTPRRVPTGISPNIYKGIEALTPDDVAEAVVFCTTRPAHVNINELIIMPTTQASAHVIHKRA